MIVAACLTAFLMGFAIHRGSTCVVLAAEEVVFDHRSRRLRSFLYASIWAGFAAMAATLIAPESFALAEWFPLSWLTLAAGAGFGLGAYINGGCAFGTLSRLSNGNFNFLGTLIGVFLAGFALQVLPSLPVAQSNPVSLQPAFAYAACLAFAILCLGVLWQSKRQGAQLTSLLTARHWSPYTALSLIGICGGFLYAFEDSWHFTATLSGHASLPAPGVSDPLLILVTLSVVVGAFLSAFQSGSFTARRPDVVSLARCVLGGAIMGTASLMIPGGNDYVILAGAPSLAPHAVATYVVMLATLIAVIALQHQLSPKQT